LRILRFCSRKAAGESKAGCGQGQNGDEGNLNTIEVGKGSCLSQAHPKETRGARRTGFRPDPDGAASPD
jgi:hypothetical protein